MSTYADFLERVQNEFLTTVKQAQDLSLKTIAATTELMSSMPKVDPNAPAQSIFPTPTEMVERGFAFTNQLLEARKEYALKLAELATDAQKQFAQTAQRVADAAKN